MLIHGIDTEVLGDLAVSTASLAELHFGVLHSKDPSVRAARLNRLINIERALVSLPIDAEVAASYGMLATATVLAGRQPRRRSFDLLIAATAHAHGARLATRNLKDFEHLADHVDLVEVN